MSRSVAEFCVYERDVEVTCPECFAGVGVPCLNSPPRIVHFARRISNLGRDPRRAQAMFAALHSSSLPRGQA